MPSQRSNLFANDLSNLPERHAPLAARRQTRRRRMFPGLAAAFLVLFAPAPRCSAAIVISEYIEGTSNNKALEIWNNGPAQVTVGTDLDLVVLVYANGIASPTSTVTIPTGTAIGA